MNHHRPHSRRPDLRAGSTGQDSFQMAPFIDVIFVLLLFYMVKLGFQQHEGQLRTQLPGVPSSVPPGLELQEEMVRIDDSGALFHNEESVSTQELTKHFQGLQQQSTALQTPLLVTLNSAPDISYAEIAHTLEALQNAGVQRITFTVDSAE